MRGNKAVLVFLACCLLLSGYFTFQLYQSKNAEHSLRMQKEQELNAKLGELSEKESSLRTIAEEKESLELKLNGKITELENSLQETKQTLSAKLSELSKLTADSDSLKADSLVKDSKIAELSKRVQALTSEKMDLLDRIKALEAQKTSVMTAPASDAPASANPAAGISEGSAPTYGMQTSKETPDISSVQLGKIVVQKSSGKSAEIIHVNKIYQFVVVNAGSDDGVRKGAIMNVLRDNAVIGKVIVEKTKENTCAAVILPEWTHQDLQTGDQVALFKAR